MPSAKEVKIYHIKGYQKDSQTSVSPDTDLLVLTSTANSIAVWTPVYSKDLILVTRQILLELSSLDIPDLEGSVFAATNEQSAVGTESNLVHRSNMTLEGEKEGSIGGVPQLDKIVEASRCEKSTVRRECDVIDLFLMTQQTGDWFR